MASDDEVEKVHHGTAKIVEPAAHAAPCAFSALGCEEPAQLGVWAQRFEMLGAAPGRTRALSPAVLFYAVPLLSPPKCLRLLGLRPPCLALLRCVHTQSSAGAG